MKTNDASLTPAELAKKYAAEHGFVISTIPALKRYKVYLLNPDTRVAALDGLIADVGGYPAALNAMKRHVEATQQVAYDTEQKPIKANFVSIDSEPAFDDFSPEQKQRVHKHYVVTTKIGDEWLPVAGAAYESYAEAIRYCRQLRNSKLSSADRPRRVEYRA